VKGTELAMQVCVPVPRRFTCQRRSRDVLSRAAQTYPNSPRLLENAICLLSNLMYDRDDNKLLICRVCGDEVRRIAL
jgi:hypothetical protein